MHPRLEAESDEGPAAAARTRRGGSLTVPVVRGNTVARSNPGYVQDVLDTAVGGSPSGDIGHMHELLLVSGIGYSLGGLLFGIALFRAGVLARWACVLLAYGTTSALALSVLPESFNRPFAVPTGVALIGLGVSLWRDQRRSAVTVDAPATVRIAEPATR